MINRTNSNLAMLKFVATKLEELVQEVVFLGGCATALLITDDAAPRCSINTGC